MRRAMHRILQLLRSKSKIQSVYQIQSHFHKLPLKLVELVKQFLNPVSKLSLALTCRRFYYSENTQRLSQLLVSSDRLQYRESFARGFWKRRDSYSTLTLINKQYCLDTTFPICSSAQYREHPWGWFISRCKQFNLPLCPHVRIGDRKITDQIPLAFGKQIYPSKYPRCDRCDSRFVVKERILSNNQLYVEIRVRRYLGNLKRHGVPQWLAQTYERKHPRLKEYCRNSWVLQKRFLRGEIDLPGEINQTAMKKKKQSELAMKDEDVLFTPIIHPSQSQPWHSALAVEKSPNAFICREEPWALTRG
ncbi:hypothetical protein FQN57_003267, partial [Myotisia sp. PD_48]